MRAMRILNWLLFAGFSLGLIAPIANASTKIAFDSPKDGDYEIYVMNEDGSDIVQLTHNTTVDVSPSWSPDGARITWRCDTPTDRQICTMNADGTNQTVILPSDWNGGFLSGPDWSPELPAQVASIASFGQIVATFLAGAVAALLLSRKSMHTG